MKNDFWTFLALLDIDMKLPDHSANRSVAGECSV